MSIPKDGVITPKMLDKKNDGPRVLVASTKAPAGKPAAGKPKTSKA